LPLTEDAPETRCMSDLARLYCRLTILMRVKNEVRTIRDTSSMWMAPRLDWGRS
jgi:hypothetical protein